MRIDHPGPAPKRLALAIAGVLLLAAANGWSMHQAAAAAPVPVGETVDPPAPPTVLVFVSGAVAHPGLYELSPDARVADAIAAAEGVTALADPATCPAWRSASIGGPPRSTRPLHEGGNHRGQAMCGAGGPRRRCQACHRAAAEIVQYRDEWGPFTSMGPSHSDLGVIPQQSPVSSITSRVVLPAAMAGRLTGWASMGIRHVGRIRDRVRRRVRGLGVDRVARLRDLRIGRVPAHLRRRRAAIPRSCWHPRRSRGRRVLGSAVVVPGPGSVNGHFGVRPLVILGTVRSADPGSGSTASIDATHLSDADSDGLVSRRRAGQRSLDSGAVSGRQGRD